jgi:hypothetical protein
MHTHVQQQQQQQQQGVCGGKKCYRRQQSCRCDITSLSLQCAAPADCYHSAYHYTSRLVSIQPGPHCCGCQPALVTSGHISHANQMHLFTATCDLRLVLHRTALLMQIS